MAPSQPPDTFHAFARLPHELRCQVWRHAAFPRILTLRLRSRLIDYRNPEPIQDDYRYFYDSVPAVLHTCRESRKYAPYVRAFRDGELQSCGTPRYVWVNFELDTIRFVHNAVNLSLQSENDCTALRRIILQFEEMNLYFEGVYEEDLKRLPNLESLEIHVTMGGISDWKSEVEFLEEEYTDWFGDRTDGWVCPEISLTDLETGLELNRRNHRTEQNRLPERSPDRPPFDHIKRGIRGFNGYRGGTGAWMDATS